MPSVRRRQMSRPINCRIIILNNLVTFELFQARMKLPKKRRRVVAVEQPRRIRRGAAGSVGHGGSGNGGGGGIHRRMNAIKGSHNQTNHTGHHGGTYRLPNTPHDKMGKLFIIYSRRNLKYHRGLKISK